MLLLAGYTNVRSKFVDRAEDHGSGAINDYFRAMLGVTHRAIRRHLIAPNDADVVIFSWNPELRGVFERNYRPAAAGSRRRRGKATASR